MASSLFLKKILDLSSEEYSLFSKTVRNSKWDSFDELISMFPEDDPKLRPLRVKIKNYINTPA